MPKKTSWNGAVPQYWFVSYSQTPTVHFTVNQDTDINGKTKENYLRMKTLTAKERYQRLFRGEPIDRIPVCPRVFENVVFEYNNRRDIQNEYMERIIEYYRIFNFDIIDWNCTPRPHFELQEFVVEGPNWKPTVKEEMKGNKHLLIAAVQTPKGNLRRVVAVTTISPWADEVAMIEYPIKTERDFDLIAEFMPEPYQLDTSDIKKTIELIADDGIISPALNGPFNILAYYYRKPDELFIDPIVNNGLYHRMMEFFLERIKKYAQQLVVAGAPLIDIGGNMANARAVSPDFLVEHILAYENNLADFIQKQGTLSLYHNCGHAAAHLGVYDKLYHRVWGYLAPEPHGDTVLEEAINILPKDMILWGHVDQIDFLRKATPREIERRVKYICDTIKPRGNYILGTTDHLETGTPPENIHAFVEAGHKHGRYDN